MEKWNCMFASISTMEANKKAGRLTCLYVVFRAWFDNLSRRSLVYHQFRRNCISSTRSVVYHHCESKCTLLRDEMQRRNDVDDIHRTSRGYNTYFFTITSYLKFRTRGVSEKWRVKSEKVKIPHTCVYGIFWLPEPGSIMSEANWGLRSKTAVTSCNIRQRRN